MKKTFTIFIVCVMIATVLFWLGSLLIDNLSQPTKEFLIEKITGEPPLQLPETDLPDFPLEEPITALAPQNK